MRITLTLALTVVVLVSGLWHPVRAQIGTGGQFELGAYGAFARYDRNSLSLSDRPGIGGRVGFFPVTSLSIEASGDYTQTRLTDTNRDRTTVTRIAGTVLAHKLLGDVAALYVGIGYERVLYRSINDFNDNGVHVVLGNRIALSSRVALRTEARLAYYPNSPVKTPGDDVLNAAVTAGLSVFVLGPFPIDTDFDDIPDRRDECAETPVGATVDERGCPTDEDGDEVWNGIDRCADTPAAAHVDAQGCPTDQDGDRVYDGIDTCPNTPLGAATDSLGCPSDRDGDGVLDGIDRCGNTSVGATVDALGCPSDTDDDGVLDGLDECPNTPRGASVFLTGCAPLLDSDGDGVDDSVDRCPDTLVDQNVDAVGCAVLFEEINGVMQLLVLRGVNFASGSAQLTQPSNRILDQVAASLLAHEEVRIEIAGHTDASGSPGVNLQLSLARAEAVREYFTRWGINPDRMVAIGFGSEKPIATNDTQIGRAQNRRVELRRINP